MYGGGSCRFIKIEKENINWMDGCHGTGTARHFGLVRTGQLRGKQHTGRDSAVHFGLVRTGKLRGK